MVQEPLLLMCSRTAWVLGYGPRTVSYNIIFVPGQSRVRDPFPACMINGFRKLDENHLKTNLFQTELIDGDYWEKLKNVKKSNTAKNPHYPTIYTVKQRHCNIVSKVNIILGVSSNLNGPRW